MSVISFFEGGINKKYPKDNIFIKDIIELIRGDKYKDKILEIRNSDNKLKRKELKDKLDYFTFGGTFSHRAKNNIIEPSGLLCLDLDNVSPLLKGKLKLNPYIHIIFNGPSGETSLKLIIKIPKITNNELYAQLYEDFSEYHNLFADPQAKDISRACFVSYDPNIYYNENSEVFNKVIEHKPKIEINSEIDIFAKIIAPNYIQGRRQEIALALCGYLRKKGYGQISVSNILKNLMHITNDSDFNERMGCVTTTFNKDIDQINGYSSLKKSLNAESFEKLINVNKEEKEESQFKVYNIQTMLKEGIPKIKFRIDPFLLENGITLFVAPSNHMKSFLAQHLSVACCTGTKFLDEFETEKSNVLYLDEENGIINIANRVKMLLKGLNLNYSDLDNRLHIVSFETIRFENDNQLQEIQRLIEEFKINVIIIDSFVRFISGDENKSSDIKFVFNILKKICNKFNISILVLHHSTKANDESARGSGDLIAAPENVFTIKKSNDLLSIKSFKERNKRDDSEMHTVKTIIETDAEGDTTSFKFVYTGQKNNSRLSIAEKRSNEFARHLTSMGYCGMTFKVDMIKDFFKINNNPAYDIINILEEQSKIKKLGNGLHEFLEVIKNIQ